MFIAFIKKALCDGVTYEEFKKFISDYGTIKSDTIKYISVPKETKKIIFLVFGETIKQHTDFFEFNYNKYKEDTNNIENKLYLHFEFLPKQKYNKIMKQNVSYLQYVVYFSKYSQGVINIEETEEEILFDISNAPF